MYLWPQRGTFLITFLFSSTTFIHIRKIHRHKKNLFRWLRWAELWWEKEGWSFWSRYWLFNPLWLWGWLYKSFFPFFRMLDVSEKLRKTALSLNTTVCGWNFLVFVGRIRRFVLYSRKLLPKNQLINSGSKNLIFLFVPILLSVCILCGIES